MLFFSVCFLGVVSGASIDLLADLMEQDAPGSSQMFIEWGQEEVMLETQYKILVGEIPTPRNFPKIYTPEFAATVMYKNPDISSHQMVTLLQKALTENRLVPFPGQQMTGASLANHVMQFLLQFSTIDYLIFDSMFVEIGFSMHVNNGQANLAQVAAIIFDRMTDQQKQSDTRFNSFDKFLYTVTLWDRMCIREMVNAPVGSNDQPCLFNQRTQKWHMTGETVIALYRILALEGIRSRR